MGQDLDIRPLGETLGAEVLGCDLDTIDAQGLAELGRALQSHGVIVLRNQKIAPASQVRLAESLGPIEIPVVSEYLLPAQSEILVLSNIVRNGRPIGARDAGQWWHVDMSYQVPPSRCTLLHAIQIPVDQQGRSLGDTLFASAAAAYDALPEADKARLSRLLAVHSHGWRYAQVVKESGGARRELSEDERRRNPDVLHPVVRPHPATGRPCLYVNEGYTARIDGMSEADSAALLQRLFDHITQPRFLYRHNWRPDDLVIWDNCLVQHRATGGYDPSQPRLMHRICVRDQASAAGAAGAALH